MNLLVCLKSFSLHWWQWNITKAITVSFLRLLKIMVTNNGYTNCFKYSIFVLQYLEHQSSHDYTYLLIQLDGCPWRTSWPAWSCWTPVSGHWPWQVPTFQHLIKDIHLSLVIISLLLNGLDIGVQLGGGFCLGLTTSFVSDSFKLKNKFSLCWKYGFHI